MYRQKWKKFTWNLSSLPGEDSIAEIKGDLRLAEKEDREACWDIIERSLMTERAWGGEMDGKVVEFKELFPKCFGTDVSQEIIVWEDGRRLVGLSAINLDRESGRQLISGVCVFEEYRCRGGGNALLLRSLHRLKEKGLSEASVVTLDNVTAAKYLYPKFDSKNEILSELPAWEVIAAK
ncbi:MAG: GNAT family N-acetyltransferase [Verrucomicrobiota bacterium]